SRPPPWAMAPPLASSSSSSSSSSSTSSSSSSSSRSCLVSVQAIAAPGSPPSYRYTGVAGTSYRFVVVVNCATIAFRAKRPPKPRSTMAPKAKATKRPRLTPAEKAAEEARQQAFACVRDHFQSLDIVWAKMSGHPWWPAMFFVSWQAVQLAGIALPPGHEKMTAQVPKTRAGAVLEEDAPPVKTCVVMFLDSFNFALLPVEPRTICTYTVHHGSLLKQSLKQAKSSMKASLKRAMARADELLHVDDREFTPVDSPELTISVEEAAALELRQLERRERRAKKLPRRLEMDVSGDPKKSPTAKKRTAAATATRRRRARAKSVEGVDVDGDEESESDVDVETTAIDLTTDAKPNKKRNRGAKRERSPVARKKSPKTINVDETPPSAPREKRVRPRKKLKAEVEDEPVKEEESEEEGVKATPLSWIWTNKTPPSEETEDKEKGEKIKAKEAAPSEDALMATTEAAGAPTEVKHELLWDDNVFVDEEKRAATAEMAPLADDQTRLVAVSSANKRSRGSMNQSQIRQNLIMGNLDPHTMVQCESYRVRDEPVVGRGRGAPSVEAPYQVVVHPEAVFVCDLHAHLATCEVIGFLGGRWDADNKVLYIQAAFPCRSLVIDGDDGSTDVEMDPGSEIELREIITSAQLEVVGWYHSHPAFAPDPSVRDIENQSNYQQLFQRRQNVPDGEKAEVMEPFVGLIVGTYDTKRDTPVSLFRYFHVRGEKVNSAICREIFWPFELVPKTRHYRSVLEDETRRTIQRMPMYPEVLSWAFRGATKWSWRKPLEPGLAADAASPEALEGTDPSVSLMTPSKKPTRKRSMSGDNGSDRKKKGSAKRRGKPAKNQGPAAVTSEDMKDADADATEVKEEEMIDVGAAFALTIAGRQRHLTALRTKYGSGSASCVEQVLALVDYYRDFNRRTDINEMWKAKIRKVDKIEASLSAYVVNLNLPAALRQEFVEDIIRYLQFSWDLTASGPSKRPRTPAAKFATQSAIK
ncbi:TPA: hypothetical protein N0F65_012126, partial [Lagenidium giganteum]